MSNGRITRQELSKGLNEELDILNEVKITTGDLALLNTDNKDSLVDAINEISNSSGGGTTTVDWNDILNKPELETVSGSQSKVNAHANDSNVHMTSAEKTKLSGIETGANNYTHPTSHPASIITQNASNRFVTDTQINTWNAKADASSVGTLSSLSTSNKANLVNSINELYLRDNTKMSRDLTVMDLTLQNGWSGSAKMSKEDNGLIKLYLDIYNGTRASGTQIGIISSSVFRPTQGTVLYFGITTTGSGTTSPQSGVIAVYSTGQIYISTTNINYNIFGDIEYY